MSALHAEVEVTSQIDCNSPSSLKKKPVLAVDIDEVLAYFMPALVNFHNDCYQESPQLTPDSFFSYDFHHVWGGSKEATMDKLDEFFSSKYFHEKIFSIPYSLSILKELKNTFDLHIVTSRQLKLEQETRKWIDKYYPNIFIDVHFGNHYVLKGTSRSKPEMCREINAVLLIDDSLKYSWQCLQAKIPVLLFGNYAWNQLTSIPILSDLQQAVTSGDVVIKDFILNGDNKNDTDEKKQIIYRINDWKSIIPAIEHVLNLTTPIIKPLINKLSPVIVGDLNITNNYSYEKNDAKLVVAAIQMNTSANKIENLYHLKELIKIAVETRNDLQFICLPECCVFMGENASDTIAASELISETTSYPKEQCKIDIFSDDYKDIDPGFPSHLDLNCVAGLCEIAFTYKVWLSIGGFPERRIMDVENNVDKDMKMSNTHFIISPEGCIASPLYRKIHLFDSPLTGLFESKSTVAGTDLVSASITDKKEGTTSNDWKIGLTICYDLRFPEVYQKLRYEHGVDMFLVPSAFTVKTGQAHWELLLRTRAVETQSYVIAAAQAGRHNAKRVSYGHTMIVDPWGSVIASLRDEEEGICFAVIDRKKISTTRENMPVQNHRRIDTGRSYL